jgi:DNA-binding CsgD family transcriptional regulator
MDTDTTTQWWTDIDACILAALADGGKTPRELSDKLGISEASVTSLLSMLAIEGRVRISRVEMTL